MKTMIPALAALAVSTAHAGSGVCGDPSAGHCCDPHGAPGCSDASCCELVCGIDPICCVQNWDSLCASLAADLCGFCNACCLPDGSCLYVTECAEFGGGFQGFLTSCESMTCIGACFFFSGRPDESCLLVSPLECSALGGEFQGNGTLCKFTTCGACCLPSGSCLQINATDCGDLGGAFQGPGSICSDAMCDVLCGLPGSGDCCDGNGTLGCEDADCCEAVCVIDPFCCVIPWDQLCADIANSTCAVCQQPGACCLADGTCLDVAGLSECTALGGDYNGGGTSCLTVTCVGACCLSDGICLQVGPSVCDGIGGTFHGVGTICQDVYCVPCAGLIAVPDDFGTIQEAIDFACRGAQIIVAPGTYAETIDFHGKAISLRSSGGRAVTSIDGQEDGSVVTCADGEGPDTVLSGFTITGGDASRGGGLHCLNSSPTVTDCVFVENHARGGGGMSVSNGSPSVNNCVFDGNWAAMGGAMHNVDSSPTIVVCIFDGNMASDDGGAVFSRHSNTVFEDCVFRANSVETGSGNGGGAVRSFDTTETLSNCHFEGNDGFLGGALLHPDFTPPAEPLLVVNCTFLDNTAMVGGAMHLQDTFATIRNCDIVGNEATHETFGVGGGVLATEGSDGGAQVTLINTRLIGNFALAQGGGIRSNGANSISLVNCTVSANVAADVGGGVSNEDTDGSVSIENSIFWNNADVNGNDEHAQIDVNGGRLDLNHSCVEGLTGALGGTGNIGEDPMFVDPRRGDLALSPGSPCIDAAHNNAIADLADTDLDGKPRFGIPAIVDMGAYEYQGVPAEVVFADFTGDGIVTIVDLMILNGCIGSEDPDCCLADLNVDGVVGMSDRMILISMLYHASP